MNIELIMPCEMYWDSYKDAYEEMDHEGCVKGMDWDGESVPEVYFQDAQNMKNGPSNRANHVFLAFLKFIRSLN